MARSWVPNFVDMAIRSCHDKRQSEGLLDHVPCYIGFHSWFPGDELNSILWGGDYQWRFQNHAFYGSLNNVIRGRPDAKTEYEKVIIFMFKDSTIRRFVKAKKARLYDDIAIRSSSIEIQYLDENDFYGKLCECINEKSNEQLETNCELDLSYDRELPIKVADSFECIIVDNEKIRKLVQSKLEGIDLEVIVSSLPRGRFV